MKHSILGTLLIAGLLVLAIGPRAYAQPDELEALLAGDTIVGQDEIQPVAIAVDAAVQSVESSAPRPVDAVDKSHSPWQSTVSLHPGLSTPDDEHAAAVSDQKPAPTSPINAVPEPSAVILALAALGYFLLFGRRHRIV